MLGSHHVNRYKILKNIKLLCWSNKVETGNTVFMMLRSVFLLLGGATSDVVIFYRILDACIMPCVLDAHLALLSFGVVVRVFYRAWNEYGTLCICSCAGLVERVFLYHHVCSLITLCGWSKMYWGLLLTCHAVNPHVEVIWHGYGWFSEWVNAVVGCSDVSVTS